MNIQQEFRKFWNKKLYQPTSVLDDYSKKTEKKIKRNTSNISNLTPYILEERQMNVTALDIFSRLMADRIIFLGEEVDSYTSNIIIAQLLFFENVDKTKDISLYINSPGGSVYDGLGIYDAMQLIQSKVNTLCVGMAASMGAVLLTAGEKGGRSALPHARVMIHQPLGGARGQESDIAIVAQQIAILKKELYEILSSHSGNDYQTIENWSDRDHWMIASDAKEKGFIDQVIQRKIN